MQTSIQLINEKISTLEEALIGTGDGGGSSGGVVYTRWGSRSCPDNIGSDLLYIGRTSGSRESFAGGASNYLCMPEAPEYTLPFSTDNQFDLNILDGVEYMNPLGGTSRADVACAVCAVEKRNMQVMIPAITTCPPNWTEEYEGYLMSESSFSHRTTYICVDSSLEFTPFTLGGTTAGYLHHVKPSCNQAGLPCVGADAYSAIRELQCVVCTK